jgi:hypothetical protein
MFFNINFLKTGIPVFNTMKNDVCTISNRFHPAPNLEVPGSVGWWRHQSRQKGGGRPDPKFDDYTQNFRICNVNSKIYLKIIVELKMLSHFVKFWLT